MGIKGIYMMTFFLAAVGSGPALHLHSKAPRESLPYQATSNTAGCGEIPALNESLFRGKSNL